MKLTILEDTVRVSKDIISRLSADRMMKGDKQFVGLYSSLYKLVSEIGDEITITEAKRIIKRTIRYARSVADIYPEVKTVVADLERVLASLYRREILYVKKDDKE